MRLFSLFYCSIPALAASMFSLFVLVCIHIIYIEHLLRHLDPQLCSHLEDNYVQAQLYGMRWSRLLLGREFKMNESGLLRIWDYIFASCVKSTGSINRSKSFLEADEDNISLWPATFTLKSSHHSSAHPILKALEDFMLAMLLQVRICTYIYIIQLVHDVECKCVNVWDIYTSYTYTHFWSEVTYSYLYQCTFATDS